MKRGFIYARVSSSKQKLSITKQLELLSTKYPEHEQLFDIASAFNFERKGLKTTLKPKNLIPHKLSVLLPLSPIPIIEKGQQRDGKVAIASKKIRFYPENVPNEA